MTGGVSDLARAMVALERRADVAATNLANASTDGFRRLVVVATSGPPVPVLRQDGIALAALGDLTGPPSGPADVVDLRPGPLERTGNPLDLALDGPGWFVVLTPQGTAYRRTGSFHVDQDGRVVDALGNPLGVEGPGGAVPLVVPAGAEHLTVSQDGTVSADGTVLGRLDVVLPPRPQDLVPGGGGLYRGPRAQPAPPGAVRVVTGAREASNVSPVPELVGLIEIERAYQSAQQAIQVWDAVDTQSASELGRIP